MILGCTYATTAVAQDNISLTTPYDGDTIETKNPLFSWFFLDGPISNGRTYYRLIVVELKPEQSPEAGIIVNQPILKMDPLSGTQLFYPYDAPELEWGHRYGWQIHKITDNILVDKSEAWEFILPLVKEQYNKYATLKTKGDGTSYEAMGGKIFFKMDENYYSEKLEFYIYDDKMQLLNLDIEDDKKGDDEPGELNVKSNGSNYYELDLGGMAKAGSYTLIVLDAKNRKYQLSFFVK